MKENYSDRKQKKKRRWLRWLVSIVIFILLVLVGSFVYFTKKIDKSLPQTEGTIELPLKEKVIIIRDENGVPHIQAENLQDLYTAQGYIQAQDRLFQMELARRQASGTLSEVIGEAAVNNDKYFRTLGLRRAAEKSAEIYDEDTIEVLQWFSDGVNAYMEEAIETGSLPIEFTLIGETPEAWTPIDSLTIGKYMAFDLGGHWERQAFNYYLLNQFSLEKAYELFPVYPKDRKTIIEDDIDIASSFKEAIIPEPFNGSNNWVVSGEKTATGKALLADDPHLGLSTPSIWYQMHLKSEEMNVSGVIFAGVPGIILGHNEQIAWGVTNTGPDVQQLYIEKRDPHNEHAFLFEGEWEEAEVIQEPIKVKGQKTIDYEVVETRHGPIVSEFAEESGKDTVLSLRWTALEATKELHAILQLNKATNWEEFEQGLEDFHAPAQNFVFASTDGTIAYKANGKIPIYEKGENALLPLPGWEQKHEWNKFIPFDELPKLVNPAKGFIATANNKVADDSYPYHISNVWAQPYRYERIAEVLQPNDQLTVQDMKNLQMDIVNLRAREFVPLFIDMLESESLSEQEQNALNLLDNWNFSDDANLPQPLLFDRWITEIEDILYKEIDEDVMRLFSSKGQTTDELLRLGNKSIWMDDNGGMTNVLHTSLTLAIDQLEESYGNKIEEWKWGDYHQVEFKHPIASANKWLGYLFHKEKPLPVGGSDVTPLAARHNGSGVVNHGASWRFVIDLSDITKGYHTVGPGQSGHLRSPWYSDQTINWVEGTMNETAIVDNEGKTLILLPNK